MITSNRIARLIATISLSFATVTLWACITQAAPMPVAGLIAKMPIGAHGSCRITEKLVTDSDGNQHIARKMVCTSNKSR